MLPKIEEIFQDLVGSKVSTKLNHFSGYLLIKMDENSKKLITFITRSGTYQFQVMPFGLMDSTATVQRMVDRILRDVLFFRAYFHYMVIFSQDIEEHIQQLDAIISLVLSHKF